MSNTKSLTLTKILTIIYVTKENNLSIYNYIQQLWV